MEIAKTVENKLALEHLAKHLPYGLKIMNHSIDDDHLFEDDKISTLGAASNCILKTDSSSTISIYNVIEHQFKPIVYPLSCLDNYQYSLIFQEFPNLPNFEIIYKNWKIHSQHSLIYTTIEYCVYDWLLRKHYDVDNLITLGLAIDVNTLEHNPYK